MKYSFRPNLFQKYFGVQLGDEQLETIDAQGRVTKSVNLSDVTNIHLLDCGNVRGSEERRHAMEHCTITSAIARSILIKSGSYAGPSEWDDHGPVYRKFRSNLIEAVARINPDATVTTGSRALVVVWRILQIAFAACFIAGVGILFSTFAETSLPEESLWIAFVCLGSGAVGYKLSSLFAVRLQPSTVTILEARDA